MTGRKITHLEELAIARRWPREAGHAMAAGIDGDDVIWRRDAIFECAYPTYAGKRCHAQIEGRNVEMGRWRALLPRAATHFSVVRVPHRRKIMTVNTAK
jgi:hypothetical protein